MNQEPRGPGRPAAAGGKTAGSVKRARELVEAAKAARPNAVPPGTAISRPTPVAQWPLVSNGESVAKADNSSADDRPYGQGTPPPRPQRPSYVPSILDASQVQDHTPVFQYRPQDIVRSPQQSQEAWEEDRVQSGKAYSETSSSSTGSIPDFPIPSMPAIPTSFSQSRRSANLGPPPSARRGAPSYYSQSFTVAPILEESESKQNSHGSFASSHAMPDSWNESIREFYEDDEEDPDRDPRHEPDESTNLVRKASMGRKHKPQLTTVKSGGSLDKDLARAKVSSPKDDAGRSPPRALHDIQEADHANVYGTGATFLDPSSSSDETVRGVNAMPSGARIQNAAEVAVDGRARLLSPREINRPPRLDLKAVRETEQRGSLTSLPDLIRRATRLASNLDRGKTASRLGMLDMFNSSDPKLLEKANRQTDARNTNSITDMLASFPPPGLGTPTPTGDRPSSRWPSPFANGQDLNHQYMSPVKPEGKRQKQQRRCCGMPVWAFTVSMLVLLIFVAAAVIIPMVLIVIPRQNASASFNYAVCPTANPCANGGSSVVSNNSCRCICANGFTGSTCATAAGPNCTTLNMDNYPNATAGSSIPRLLTAAQTNFSVPLNATLLLSLFSATNISCASEDSLVTFSSGPQRREIAQQVDLLAAFEGSFPPHPTPVAQLAERGAGAAASTTAIPIATAPPSTQAQGSTMPGNQPITQSDLDFGRVAVLFVMQESNDPSSAVNSGIVVLDRLQGVFLGNTFSPGKVMVGNNVTVDFATATIDMGNGTVVGGKGLR